MASAIDMIERLEQLLESGREFLLENTEDEEDRVLYERKFDLMEAWLAKVKEHHDHIDGREFLRLQQWSAFLEEMYAVQTIVSVL